MLFYRICVKMIFRFREPNSQLNVCTTSVTEGEVAGVIHY